MYKDVFELYDFIRIKNSNPRNEFEKKIFSDIYNAMNTGDFSSEVLGNIQMVASQKIRIKNLEDQTRAELTEILKYVKSVL